MIDKAVALYKQGIENMEKCLYDQAAKLFIEARKVDPHSVDLAFNLGLARLKEGRLHDAKQAFTEALDMGCTDDADLFSNLGLCYFNLGNEATAETMYRQALSINPHHPEAANNIGVIFFQRGDFKTAKHFFEIALKSRPNYADAKYNLRDTIEHLK